MSNKFVEDCRADGQKIERLIRGFYSSLPERRAFIDGGAFHGYHMSYATTQFQNRVIAIEASPDTYITLMEKHDAFQSTNQNLCDAIPLHAALGSREKQGNVVNFYFSKTHPGRSTVNTQLWDVWGKGEVVYENPIAAPVLEIDDIKKLMARDLNVDFIKLDLEGNEINALIGAAQVMKNDRPCMVMEFGLRKDNEDAYGITCDAFVELMRGRGYRLYSPWGIEVTDKVRTDFVFWYIFAIPDGPKHQTYVDLLKAAYQAEA